RVEGTGSRARERGRRARSPTRAPAAQSGRVRKLHSRSLSTRAYRCRDRGSIERMGGRARSGTPVGQTDLGMVGEVIAERYELQELCGSGGMSMVYRAHDRLLERTVALKLLHERHLDDDESIERFRREARSAAALSHPNIVTVIDRGQHEGRP